MNDISLNLLNYCLLDDAILSVTLTHGRSIKTSLAEVFAAAHRDELESFDALRAHQRQAWYCLLVQLAALCKSRVDDSLDDTVAASWRRRLLELAAGVEQAWWLVTEDTSLPAFMQAPIPEGGPEEASYKADVHTPDQLDVLVTAKNMDVKMARILRPEPEHWLYALVTLQTTEGFLGRGNYGIARMNGGFASRPFVGVAPSHRWGARIMRDARVLLEGRVDIAAEHGFALDGEALLWTVPWDGAKDSSLSLSKCDPFFVEICRRIRFTKEQDKLACWRANTDAARVSAPKDLHGIVGDPWAPVDQSKKKDKSFTLNAAGYNYAMVQRLLTGDFRPSTAQKITSEDPEQVYLRLQGLVRGQGKTEGLHERVVVLPKPIARRLRFGADPDERRALLERAKRRVQESATMRRNVLLPAVLALLHAGSSGVRSDNRIMNKAQHYTKAFDEDIDAVFFSNLFTHVGVTEEDDRAVWRRALFELAEGRLEGAIASSPLPSTRRFRAITAATGMLRGLAAKHFEELEQAAEPEPVHEDEYVDE